MHGFRLAVAELGPTRPYAAGLVRASGAADASASSQSGTPMITKNAQLVYVAPRLAALAHGAYAILLCLKNNA